MFNLKKNISMISKSKSQSLEIKGLVKKIFDVQYLKYGFKKIEILLLTEEQYPQKLIIEFIQEKVKLLNSIGVGDRIKVFINLKGRKWISSNGTEKYFNSIQGWKIEKKIKRKSSNISESESESKSESESESESEYKFEEKSKKQVEYSSLNEFEKSDKKKGKSSNLNELEDFSF